MAKALHRDHPCDQSEATLLQAYASRVEALLGNGQVVDARALINLVTARFPAARDKLADLELRAMARKGDFDRLVEPLSHMDVDPAVKQNIENIIRRELRDPEHLAECPSLSESHPLREAARAMGRALEHVTSGPVDNEALTGWLREVSRKSPLAPWKHLIHALRAFYRHEDEPARKALDLIPKDTAPAEFCDVLRHLMGDTGRELSKSAQTLVEAVSGNCDRVSQALSSLDRAVIDGGGMNILNAIRRAVRIFSRECPELLPKLAAHAIVQTAYSSDTPFEVLNLATGGHFQPNAYFWHAMALKEQYELLESGDMEPLPFACSSWERYYLHAVAEGQFSPHGPEAGALFLHVANLITVTDPGLSPEERDQLHTHFHDPEFMYSVFYRMQPLEILQHGQPMELSHAFLDAYAMFEKSCDADPLPGTYVGWYTWAESSKPYAKTVDHIAERWHRDFPNDVQPLLKLGWNAIKRKAFNKALDYLDQAESIDRLHAQVRSMRVSVLTSITLRHVMQEKAHLVEKDIAAIEACDLVDMETRAILCAALRWLVAAATDQDEVRDSHFEQIEALAGNTLRAVLLLWCLGLLCKRQDPWLRRRLPSPEPNRVQDDIVSAMTWAARRIQSVGLQAQIPDAWVEPLRQIVIKKTVTATPSDLAVLASLAIDQRHDELAFHLTRHGLPHQSSDTASMLFLRARSLPGFAWRRKHICFRAAIQRARQAGQQDLVESMVARAQEDGAVSRDFRSLGSITRPLSPENLNAVIRREQEETDLPLFQDYWDGENELLVNRVLDAQAQPSLFDNQDATPLDPEYLELFDDDEDELEFPDLDALEDLEFPHAGSPHDWDPEVFETIARKLHKARSNQGLVPPEVSAVFMEAMLKYGDGKHLPDPDVVRAADPDLFHRMEATIDAFFDAMDPLSDKDARESKSGASKARKSNRKKKRR